MRSLRQIGPVVAGLMAACLVLAACGGGEEEDETTTRSIPTTTSQMTPSLEAAPTVELRATRTVPPTSWQGIGAESIWDPAEDPVRLARLNECRGVERLTECVVTAMQELEASPQAMEFLRLSGWFLAGFQEMGRVDLGTIATPWRANENVQLAFLNGTPMVVYPEQEGELISIEHDPDYETLLASFPHLGFWPSGSRFEAASPGDQGGQRFVLQFRLIDGCRACRTGYFARVAFDFASDGTYFGGPALLGVCKGKEATVTPADAAIPACPIP